jgi:branched-chain amino acid transport system permease protein
MAQKRTISKGLFLGILIIVGIALPFFSGNFIIRFVTNALMFAVLASAWNIIGGYTGYASFGNVVFLGIGAYVSAVLMEKGGFPFWVGFAASGFGAAVFAILIGLPVLRLKGHYFAIATLGVAEAMKALVDNLEITEGNSGIYLPVMDLSVKSQYIFFYFMMMGVLILTLVITYIFLKRKLGYGLIAIREDEEAANSLGVNTTLFKVTSFALSGFFSGLAGSLYAYQQGFIKPESVFDVGVTIKMIVMAVFGGIGSILGPLLGALSIEIISEVLTNYFLIAHTLFFGAIVIFAIVFTPKGIMDIISGRKKFGISYLLQNIRDHRV